MLKRQLRSRKASSIQPQDLTYRPPLYSPGFPFILMWSEKSACTTVAKWFFAQIGLLKRALSYHRWIHEYENSVFKARKGYLESCCAAFCEGVASLKFVRNPYTRLYSGYLETCSPRVLSQPEHWSTLTRAKVLEHLVGESVGLEYGYSFNQFVNWVAEQSPNDLDPHLAPQFESYENQANPRVVRIEDGDNVFQLLEAEYNLTSTEGRKLIYSSGHHHTKVKFKNTENASILDVSQPVTRTASFQIFDASARTIAASPSGEKIRERFYEDFKAYGYPTAVGP